MLKPLLKFFRIVNLPTAPGDALAGAAAVLWGAAGSVGSARPVALAGACLASCLVYLFGMADNDVVGAATDGPERPIPAGELSPFAGRAARNVCLGAAAFMALAAGMPAAWWLSAAALVAAILAYNRAKRAALMGLCRGLNVVCGGAVLLAGGNAPRAAWWFVAAVALAWTIYATLVTAYSADEAEHPEKRRRVGALVGAIVYLQLAVLVAAYWLAPCLALRNMMLVGAAMLLLLRLLKRSLPGVSAS